MLRHLVETSRQRRRPPEDEAFWKILCFVEDRLGPDCSPCEAVDISAAAASRRSGPLAQGVQETQACAPCTPDILQTCPGTPIRPRAEGLPKRRRLSTKSPDPHSRNSMDCQSFCPGTPNRAFAEDLTKQRCLSLLSPGPHNSDSLGCQTFCPGTPVQAFSEGPIMRRRLSMKSPDPERRRVPQTPDRFAISAPGTPMSVFAPSTPASACSPVRRRLRSKSPAREYRPDMPQWEHDTSKPSCVSSLLERLASKTSGCTSYDAPKSLRHASSASSLPVHRRSPQKPAKRNTSANKQTRESASATTVTATSKPWHSQETQQSRVSKRGLDQHTGTSQRSTRAGDDRVAAGSAVCNSNPTCKANLQLEAAREPGRKGQRSSGSGLQLPPSARAGGDRVAVVSAVCNANPPCKANRQLEAAREPSRKAQRSSGSGLQMPPARKRCHSARN